MPLGEFIGEILLRGFLEIVFYAASYYTGAIALWILTFGRLRIAPFSSIETTNRGKNRWNDWSIWLHRPFQGRVLKAECVCLAGLIVWIGIGVWIYFTWQEKQPSVEATAHSTNFGPITTGPNEPVQPQLDESKAKDYVGKTVLIGVTYLDHEEKQTAQQQWYGVITEVSNARGIVIALKNDTNYCALPPDLSALRPANPGEYRLRSTGEVVTNPDFVTTWTRRAADPRKKPR